MTNNYDGCNNQGYPTLPTYGFDVGAIWTMPLRGLVSSSITPAGTSTACYYWYGQPYQATGVSGVTTTSTVTSSTDYTMPNSISTPTYGNTMSYNSWLGLTSTSGSNGETMTMTYDGYGRPATATSPHGALTTYAYSASGAPAAWQSSTGPSGWQQTTLDGFGRAILVQSGPNSSTITSQADTFYYPCACSPLGKLQKTSQPYKPGDPEYWTQYAYDGIGRTLTMLQPDGHSASSYSYTGNQTTVTDAAGNWKTFTSDVMGNLITVLEPNPAGGTFTTSYTYDWMNHLTGTSMTRGTTTQTRTFSFNTAGQLTSAQNPENGFTYYYYNPDMTLQYKADMKGQATVYSYDASKRITMVQFYPNGLTGSSGYFNGVNWSEDICRRVTYGYDAGTYGWGRLTSIGYGISPALEAIYAANSLPAYTCPGTPTGMGYAYQETYSYDSPGSVTQKSFGISTSASNYTQTGVVPVTYTYDSAGRLLTTSYPRENTTTPPTYTYTYDSMGRPLSMSDNDLLNYNGVFTGSTGTTWALNTQYDAAGRMTNLDTYLYWVNLSHQTWTYNSNEQLSAQTWTTMGGSAGVAYNYSSTQNNGQITSSIRSDDFTQSNDSIAYTYDSLRRLTSATATPVLPSVTSAWTETYQYDGFGNLTYKNLNGLGNTVPAIDQTTNRLLTSGYDANGNMLTGFGLTMTYDERNRLASATVSSVPQYYGYAPDNQRIYVNTTGGGSEVWHLYGARGEKIGQFSLTSPYYGTLTPVQTNVWFAGKLVHQSFQASPPYSQTTHFSRLGSDAGDGVEYYPYGEQISYGHWGSPDVGFASYMHDGFSDLEYADQRYYVSGYGRFNTPDPGASKAAKSDDPISWNQYAYTKGDPINRSDQTGLFDDQGNPEYCDVFPDDPECQTRTPEPPPPSSGASAGPLYTWSLDVGYTPVVNFARIGGTSLDHLFIWIHPTGDSSPADGGLVFDGGPNAPCFGPRLCGGLTAWSSPNGHYNELTNPAAVDFYTTQLGPSDNVYAAQVLAQLIQDWIAIIGSVSSHPYNGLLGPNSNSLVYSDLRSIGISVPITTVSSTVGSIGELNWKINGQVQLFTGWGQNILP